MKRYKLYVDKLVNVITPAFQRGRNNILFIQSLLKPLQMVNDTFILFAKEKTIEANVTSQVKHFEWYLNHKLSTYYVNTNDKIRIVHYTSLGVPLYTIGAAGAEPFIIWGDDEDWTSADLADQPKPLYTDYEAEEAFTTSFSVIVPEVNIDHDKFDILIKAEIEKYRIAGKTYVIKHI